MRKRGDYRLDLPRRSGRDRCWVLLVITVLSHSGRPLSSETNLEQRHTQSICVLFSAFHSFLLCICKWKCQRVVNDCSSTVFLSLSTLKRYFGVFRNTIGYNMWRYNGCNNNVIGHTMVVFFIKERGKHSVQSLSMCTLFFVVVFTVQAQWDAALEYFFSFFSSTYFI